MKILLTGFDPFGGEEINPAWETAKRVKSNDIIEIIPLMVPTLFGRSIEIVIAAIEEYLPDVVICLGQAGGRADITPERVAINISDARIADNDGVSLVDQPIYPDGDAAYFSSLPVKEMVQAINNVGLPASLSNSAGTYVCNHLMYGVLHYISKNHPKMRGGFIHIPYIPEQVIGKSAPSMSLYDIVRGIEAAVEKCVV